jgi:hypothetical protein
MAVKGTALATESGGLTRGLVGAHIGHATLLWSPAAPPGSRASGRREHQNTTTHFPFRCRPRLEASQRLLAPSHITFHCPDLCNDRPARWARPSDADSAPNFSSRPPCDASVSSACVVEILLGRTESRRNIPGKRSDIRPQLQNAAGHLPEALPELLSEMAHRQHSCVSPDRQSLWAVNDSFSGLVLRYTRLGGWREHSFAGLPVSHPLERVARGDVVFCATQVHNHFDTGQVPLAEQ